MPFMVRLENTFAKARQQRKDLGINRVVFVVNGG